MISFSIFDYRIASVVSYTEDIRTQINGKNYGLFSQTFVYISSNLVM